jgi:hypothetical protein
MSLPGTTVTLVDTPPPRSAPTDTSVWFIAGFTEKGPVTPQLVTSLAAHDRLYGSTRVAWGVVRDSLEVFFREGGGRAYVSRVVGPTPVLATLNLLDGSSAISLVAKAKSYGAWGNAIKVAVQAGGGGGTFKISVLYNDVEVENSGDLATTADAVAWGVNSSYIDLIQGASTNDPAVAAAAALTTGTDDHSSATDTEWNTAINRFGKALGPGQVSMPGRTTDTAHTNLLAHAASHNRFAILDFIDTATAASILTDVADARSANARWGAAFGPWAIVPGVVPKTTRTIPYSAIESGIIARNEAAGLNPDVPAAGRNGQSVFALDLTQTYSDADRESLNNAGFNVAVIKYGGVRTYGYRSLANPTTESNYIEASNMRLVMAITAEADGIAEDYLFQVIDGQGHLLADFKGDLVGMLKPYYDAGALYGATAAEAFFVDVGPQVNTPETIAAQELHAVLSLRMSPFAETVQINIVKKAVTEPVT